jgi:hypothetical protein
MEKKENPMNRTEFLKLISNKICTNPICSEIGVLQGDFSKQILDVLKPSELFLIDPWEVGSDKNSPQTKYSGSLSHLHTAYSQNADLKEVQSKFANQIENHSVIIKQGYSYDFVNEFPNEYFDFIYIDATHFYESVKADLAMYLPKLKKTGIISGHDYTNNYNDLSFGVVQAVDEIVLSHNLKWVCLSGETDFALMY